MSQRIKSYCSTNRITKRRSRAIVVFSVFALAVCLTTVDCFAQTHLNDYVGPTLAVDPTQLFIPANGVIGGSYQSFKDFNYYDWYASFEPGNSPEGGWTTPNSAHVLFGSPPSGVKVYAGDRWVVLGADHNVYFGDYSVWSAINQHPPVQFVSRPALCEVNDGEFYIAAVLGADGNVYVTLGAEPLNGSSVSWVPWSSVGRPPVGANSAPAIAGSSIVVQNVAVRGTDGAIWHIQSSLFGWSSWESLGGHSISAPALCALPNGRLDAWCIGANQEVWHSSKSTGSGWTGWTDELGTPPHGGAGAPTVVANQTYGDILVFVPESSDAYDYGPQFAERYWNGKAWSAWRQTTVDFYNSNVR
jgi:hypothetical protein